jgi:hypothetical protein
MNQHSSTDSSVSSGNGRTDAISRRAYELWEKDGRPEGCELRHWLQAEQELGATSSADNGKLPQNGNGSRSSDSTMSARTTAADTRPMQGTRGAPPAPASNKRGSASPFSGDRNGNSNGGQNSAKRKPSSAPVL